MADLDPSGELFDAQLLRSILAALPTYVLRVDRDFTIRYINRLKGLRSEEVIGTSILDLIREDYRDVAQRTIESVLATGEPGRWEVESQALGDVTIYESSVTPVFDGDEVTGVVIISVDITEQRRRERALAESEAKLRHAVEATGVGLWSWDLKTNEVTWDQRMREICKLDEPLPLDRYVTELVHPEDRQAVRENGEEILRRHIWEDCPHRIVRPDGSITWIYTTGQVLTDEAGEPVRILGGSLDVSATHELQEQLRHAQKMEAVGNLTAGIAHNFNNMLTSIVPTLELLGRVVPPSHQAMLADATNAALRAGDVVRQLMTFAGQRLHRRGPVSLNDLLDEATGIGRRAIESHIAIHTAFDAGDVRLRCDAGAIEQIVVNLLLNARDALQGSEVERRRIVVGTHLVERAPADRVDAEARPWVAVSVSDNGPGISLQRQARIFEPFFTTKESGRGTGLGLATSYAIARDHGGWIECRSEPGAGATFTLFLPRSDCEAAAARRRGAVLVIDDELVVRNAVKNVLCDTGRPVICAADGDEALAHAVASPDISVVLLDCYLSDERGDALIPELRRLLPGAGILFFSGQRVDEAALQQVDGLIEKPVRRAALVAAIESASREDEAARR